ncbi:acyl-CoA dehydrogenase family protein [Alcanivorax sp. DP30]|uniref:acyl-CoA dehydrogenase family protein n=1 Tax=Alcanivorax sp. DP30 TaxID=2606217 RepID=UPI00136D257C|nr:acyl-CoA dehydrogenase family protein [Alcanivorax sp. DP30]MZR62289.1 DNA alkylation response protein [Alcanivorax sp. DP30]
MNAKHDSLKPDPLAQTHEVFNQARVLENYNPYETDTALREAVQRHGAGWAEPKLLEHGARTGTAEVIEWGFLANEHKPQFFSHDRQGYRVDYVKYHESYHRLMALGLESGMHSSPWTDPKPGAHVARAAQSYLQAQVEAGHGCPLTMTFAAVPSISLTPSLAKEWLPKILNNAYNPRNVPHYEKEALTIGMGMTEKQGGSDVRANTTRAWAIGAEGTGEAYELVGHKWFTSAPMCDAFLVLAQTENGLSCFLVPRWRPDGSKNPIQVQRLKNKMGNVSNASSEIELRGALGWMVGEEGRGVPAIIEMVAMTRFDCMIGSMAGQRQAVAQAVNHASGRAAFGKTLLDQPLMRNVLADLQLEVEGSLAIAMRMGEALDQSTLDPKNDHEKLLLRLGLPAGKYWICKRSPFHAYEAMECLGGNGVTEDFIMARLYREAPINAIWEGSGNVQALDMLRALAKTPTVLETWFAELDKTRGSDVRLDKAVDALKQEFRDMEDAEYRARDIVDRLSLTMQASQLVAAGNQAVAEAFIASRLGQHGDRNYGTLPRGLDLGEILGRADPWESN